MTNFKTLAFLFDITKKANIGDLQSKHFLWILLQNCHLINALSY